MVEYSLQSYVRSVCHSRSNTAVQAIPRGTPGNSADELKSLMRKQDGSGVRPAQNMAQTYRTYLYSRTDDIFFSSVSSVRLQKCQ